MHWGHCSLALNHRYKHANLVVHLPLETAQLMKKIKNEIKNVPTTDLFNRLLLKRNLNLQIVPPCLRSTDLQMYRKRCSNIWLVYNTLRPRQHSRHFADIFKWGFLIDNHCINKIQISLSFVPKGPIVNKSSLVQLMAWHWTGDKPFSGLHNDPLKICKHASHGLNEINSNEHPLP